MIIVAGFGGDERRVNTVIDMGWHETLPFNEGDVGIGLKELCQPVHGVWGQNIVLQLRI